MDNTLSSFQTQLITLLTSIDNSIKLFQQDYHISATKGINTSVTGVIRTTA